MNGMPSPYRDVSKADWNKLGLRMVAAGAAIVAGALCLIPLAMPFGFLAWLFLFVGGSLFLFVRWHANAVAYRCPRCGHEFEISAWRDFISPHMPSVKYLKCPSCATRGWAAVRMKINQ
jgi:DNA-directed RNA polymerase subunit RPC12/RpoP